MIESSICLALWSYSIYQLLNRIPSADFVESCLRNNITTIFDGNQFHNKIENTLNLENCNHLNFFNYETMSFNGERFFSPRNSTISLQNSLSDLELNILKKLQMRHVAVSLSDEEVFDTLIYIFVIS